MLTYPKTGMYLLACSFGPDSMALFDMLYQEGYRFAVGHVNYHKRDVSNFEEESLRNYCQVRNIPFFVCDTANLAVTGNFQAWARKVRYDFFQKIYEEIKASGLFVAHHLDDLLETYIWQKERHSIPTTYGLMEKTSYQNMVILRPLLACNKSDLKKYCDDHKVPYSIDVSNLGNDYRRNQIRHQMIEKMTDDEKHSLLTLIQEENAGLLKKRESISGLSHLKINDLLQSNGALQLRTLLMEHFPHRSFSEKFIVESLKALKTNKPLVTITLDEQWSLIKDYDTVKISSFLHWNDYKYIMEEPKSLDTPYFVIDFTTHYEDRRVTIQDFPLLIRNSRPLDYIIISGNTKKISRLFVEWKMPHELRRIWPIILNKAGKIIYVPRYKRDYVAHKDANFQIKELN